MGMGVSGAGHETNWLVRNLGLNPLVGYNFMLRVEALYDLPCKSIKGFEKKNEYEYIQEGGLNDYVHMLRKPITQPFTFQVERYVGIDYFDPIPLGAQLILPTILIVSRNQNDDKNFVPIFAKRTYIFTGCEVVGKQYGELDAERSGLLVETTTIAYRQLIVFNNPVDVEMDKFDSSQKIKATTSTKPTARKWTFDKTNPTKNLPGTPVRTDDKNKAITQLKPTPRLWKYNSSTPTKNLDSTPVRRDDKNEVITQLKPTPRAWLSATGKLAVNYKDNTVGVVTYNKVQAAPKVVRWKFDKQQPTKNLETTPSGARTQKKPISTLWKYNKSKPTENLATTPTRADKQEKPTSRQIVSGSERIGIKTRPTKGVVTLEQKQPSPRQIVGKGQKINGGTHPTNGVAVNKQAAITVRQLIEEGKKITKTTKPTKGVSFSVTQPITPRQIVKANQKIDKKTVLSYYSSDYENPQKLPTVRHWPPTKSAVTVFGK